jgi:hypothetical protein
MYKQLVSALLLSVLVHAFVSAPVLASTDAEKRIKLAEKAKAGVVKLGLGRDARVSVKRWDKTKLAGYVSKTADDLFVVTDLQTGESTPVAYADVAQVKGNNLSTGVKIAIGIGIGVGATLLILYLIFAPRT